MLAGLPVERVLYQRVGGIRIALGQVRDLGLRVTDHDGIDRRGLQWQDCWLTNPTAWAYLAEHDALLVVVVASIEPLDAPGIADVGSALDRYLGFVHVTIGDV